MFVEKGIKRSIRVTFFFNAMIFENYVPISHHSIKSGFLLICIDMNFKKRSIDVILQTGYTYKPTTF